MKTSMDQLAKADWDTLERDVVQGIRALRAIACVIERNETTEKIANELILPNLSLLAEFCENVKVSDGDEHV